MSAAALGRELRALRLQRGLTLADLAGKMGLTTSEISRRELGLEFADDPWFQAASRACGAPAGAPVSASDEPALPMAIPGGPPGGCHRVAPCPIHNTVQIDLVSGTQLCPCCCVVGDSSAWTVKVQRPSYHAMHVHLKEGAEATARERFWAEADRGSHVELLHGDRVVRSVQIDAEGLALHLPTDERALQDLSVAERWVLGGGKS